MSADHGPKFTESINAVDVIAGWISFQVYHDGDYDGESKRDAEQLLRRLADFGFEVVRRK